MTQQGQVGRTIYDVPSTPINKMKETLTDRAERMMLGFLGIGLALRGLAFAGLYLIGDIAYRSAEIYPPSVSRSSVICKGGLDNMVRRRTKPVRR
jgi:hypothetical protein